MWHLIPHLILLEITPERAKEEIFTRNWVLGYVTLSRTSMWTYPRKEKSGEKLLESTLQIRQVILWFACASKPPEGCIKHCAVGPTRWDFLIQKIGSRAWEFAFLMVSFPGDAEPADPHSHFENWN